jgi:hypothetical protein
MAASSQNISREEGVIGIVTFLTELYCVSNCNKMHICKQWCNLNSFLCSICYRSLMQVNSHMYVCICSKLWEECEWDSWVQYDRYLPVGMQKIVTGSFAHKEWLLISSQLWVCRSYVGLEKSLTLWFRYS